MHVNIQRLRGTRGGASLRSSERGFSVLEVLVIIVIVSVFVAVGVPMLHSGAKAAVLDANVRSLATLVDELAMDGYSSEYRPSGDGDPAVFLSLQLEKALSTAGKGSYVNPTVGSRDGRVILNSSTMPTDPKSVPPAVFITDSPAYQHQTFNILTPESQRLLAGSLVVAFNVVAGTVDVFSVDEHGQASAKAVDIPIG